MENIGKHQKKRISFYPASPARILVARLLINRNASIDLCNKACSCHWDVTTQRSRSLLLVYWLAVSFNLNESIWCMAPTCQHADTSAALEACETALLLASQEGFLEVLCPWDVQWKSMEIVWWWIAKFCAPQLCFSKFAHCSETLGCCVCFSFGARWFRSFWATSTLVWVQPFNTEQADEMRQEHGLETGEYTFKGSTDWQHGTDRICTFPVLSRPRSKATNSPAADGMGA